MSEKETGDFLRASTDSPNVMEIHCSTMPFGNQSIMTVTIPGHVPYRELYRTHPDNTLITAFTLLRRVANDYAALLAKCSATHEEACSEILSQAAQQDVKEKFGGEAGLARRLQDETLESFGYALTDEATQREHRRDALLRAALRVLDDLL